MAAGLQVVRSQFDGQVGSNTRQVVSLLTYFNDTNNWISGVAGGFAGLKDTSGIFGAQAYTDVPGGSGDASRLFNGVAAMAKMYALLHGTQSSPYTVTDLTADIKFLTGIP